MKRHIDPDFSYHLALGQLWGYVGFALADIPLLPFSVEDEAEVLKTVVDDIQAKYGPVLAKHSVSLGLFNPFQRPFQQPIELVSIPLSCSLFTTSPQQFGVFSAEFPQTNARSGPDRVSLLKWNKRTLNESLNIWITLWWNSELMLRIVNDQMMQLEKAFVFSEGLLHRSHMKYWILTGYSSKN